MFATTAKGRGDHSKEGFDRRFLCKRQVGAKRLLVSDISASREAVRFGTIFSKQQLILIRKKQLIQRTQSISY
jgi:hypothetical protein